MSRVNAMGADREKGTRGGALEQGDGAALEGLKQLGDTLGSVGAVAVAIDATEPVVGQAARERGVSMRVDSKAQGRGRRRT